MMRKFRALDGAMENLGSFDDAMGKLETLIKQWGNCVGEAKWPDGEKGKLGP